jgi:hypothetical protein
LHGAIYLFSQKSMNAMAENFNVLNILSVALRQLQHIRQFGLQKNSGMDDLVIVPAEFHDQRRGG